MQAGSKDFHRFEWKSSKNEGSFQTFSCFLRSWCLCRKYWSFSCCLRSWCLSCKLFSSSSQMVASRSDRRQQHSVCERAVYVKPVLVRTVWSECVYTSKQSLFADETLALRLRDFPLVLSDDALQSRVQVISLIRQELLLLNKEESGTKTHKAFL